MVQGNVPLEAGVESVIVLIKLEPSVAYSSFTLVMVPTLFQVMLETLPTVQLSPPLGWLKVNMPWMVRSLAELSVTTESFMAVILTLTLSLIASATVQA